MEGELEAVHKRVEGTWENLVTKGTIQRVVIHMTHETCFPILDKQNLVAKKRHGNDLFYLIWVDNE